MTTGGSWLCVALARDISSLKCGIITITVVAAMVSQLFIFVDMDYRLNTIWFD